MAFDVWVMFKKRSDAWYCYDVGQYMRIFPYIFRRRCDCTVYYEIEYDVTNLIKFVHEYNREHRVEFSAPSADGSRKFPLRMTTGILIAFARTLAIRPKMNRFIKNSETWQRKEISEVFIVKKSMDEDSPELSEELVFDPKGSFDSYVQQIEGYINRCETSDLDELNQNDLVVGNLFKFMPKWLLRLAVAIYEWKDTKHGVGKWLHRTDCLHASVFVANLSSLGVSSSAPHHHLYQWGTTSTFCIFGPLKRTKIQNEDGSVSHKDTIKLSFTVDERICDGFYFIKTLRIIGDFLENPEKLLHVPDDSEIPHLMTAKEYRKSVRERKKALKERKRAKKRENKENAR